MNDRKNKLTSKKIVKDYERLNHPSWDIDKTYTKDVCLDAEIKHEELKTILFDSWKLSIEDFSGNTIFSDCVTMNGISKKYFLKRFIAYRPVSNLHSNCSRILNQLCDALDPQEVSKNSFIKNTDTLDNMCSVFATTEWYEKLVDWMVLNSGKLWTNISACLLLEDDLIVPEICIALSFLVYRMSANITENIINVFTRLVYIVLDCSREFDKYAEKHRVANDKYQKLRRPSRQFFFSPFKGYDVNYTLLSSAFYCQAFILNYYFKIDLFQVFLPMIEEMSEVGKYFHLNLLTLAVEKLETMIHVERDNVKLLHMTEFIFEQTINFSIDRNVMNKTSIININSTLRSTLQILIPNAMGRFKRKSSYEMKIIIARRRNREETENYRKASVNSLNSE